MTAGDLPPVGVLVRVRHPVRHDQTYTGKVTAHNWSGAMCRVLGRWVTADEIEEVLSDGE